jgi:hypothetical protein
VYIKTGEFEKLEPETRGSIFFSNGVTEKSFELFMEEIKEKKSSHYITLVVIGNLILFMFLLLVAKILSTVG